MTPQEVSITRATGDKLKTAEKSMLRGLDSGQL